MCGAAALFAGCKFFGGYPITPASEIMQYLGREIWKHGGSLLQAEDEIAGIAAAVGASFAGVKAMTATSGPGLSLKTEVLGLASVAELPLVCVDVQRGGPSTGMPTKPEQADLFAAVFSAHGDTVRPVLAPISVADTFGVTVEAFNIAEQYQTPVHRALGPGDRPAQGDRRSDRHFALQAGRTPPADRAGTGELRPVPVHGIRHQPAQPSRHEGRQLPGRRHRAQRTGRPDGERRDARPHERQAAQEDGPAADSAATSS